MSDMFEYLEAQAREDDGPFVNATSVSVDRAERRFASFLSSAQGDKEFASRMNLVSDDIYKIAADVCEEFGYDDPEHVARIVMGQMEVLAARNSDSAKTDSIGDIKREKLDSQDPSGYYTEPSPKLNPGSAGDNMKNTNPAIAELTPDDHQEADDASWPHDADISGYANLVDADKPMQPENHVGDNTMTFPNKGQADPVTSKKKSNALGGDDPDHAGEWAYPNQSMEQIQKRLQEGASMEQIRREFSDFIRQNNLSQNDLYQIGLERRVGAADPNDPDAIVDEAINSVVNEEGSKFDPAMAKAAAERMDFASFAEMMTPSEAIGELVDNGMPHHEAKDRIDFYVNHINPGWAHKHWTSAAEGGWREPQTPQEVALVELETKKFERALEAEVEREVQSKLNGRDGDRVFVDQASGQRFTLRDLADSGQLQEIIRGQIMKVNPDAGVKGISVETGGVYVVPLTKSTDQNYVQQQITERDQKTIPGADRGVTIGDRAIQQRSQGLDPSRGPGPLGGPTGL